MKTILIATDFSRAAENAAVYTAELAANLNARVILFSAYQQVPIAVAEAPLVVTQEEVQLQVETQLADTARLLSAHRSIPIQTCCMTGNAAKAILNAVKEYKPDLVVAGMKKKGQRLRRVFGSTVTKLIRQITTPLLVVPEEAKFTNINAIALANESDLPNGADPHTMDALRELTERFHSKLYMVRVADNCVNRAFQISRRPAHLSLIFKELGPEFRCIEGEDIAETLTRFVGMYNIDILAMIPHKYSLLERWFIMSATREMAFTTAVPLLLLPESMPALS